MKVMVFLCLVMARVGNVISLYHENGLPGRGLILARVDAVVPSPLYDVQDRLDGHVKLGRPLHLQVS